MSRNLLNNSGSAPTFSTSSEISSPLQLLSSDNDFGPSSPLLAVAAMFTEEAEYVAESINLDDVLEASYLAPESSETTGSIAKQFSGDVKEGDDLSSDKHLQNLNRWDLIPVSAFRRTRENGGWSSDHYPHTPHSSMDYSSIMKASPLSAIMWFKEKERQRRRNFLEPMSISPVILPVGDGDRTPTGAETHQHDFNQDLLKSSQKLRRESKRERKLKKKNWGQVHHQHANHHHWHSHQHHPNSKTRGTASNQRSFPSAVPPFNL